jgi:hypothetical protein
MVTMSQKSFVPQAAKSVSQALMSDKAVLAECHKVGFASLRPAHEPANETEGAIRTLDADHERNCCIQSMCSP